MTRRADLLIQLEEYFHCGARSDFCTKLEFGRFGLSDQALREICSLSPRGRGISTWSMLPDDLVRHTSVHAFQSALQGLVLVRALAGMDQWQFLLSTRWELYRHPLR